MGPVSRAGRAAARATGNPTGDVRRVPAGPPADKRSTDQLATDLGIIREL